MSHVLKGPFIFPLEFSMGKTLSSLMSKKISLLVKLYTRFS